MYQQQIFLRISVQESNSVFGDNGATHADLMETVQSFVCVLIGVHGRDLTTNTHVKRETN